MRTARLEDTIENQMKIVLEDLKVDRVAKAKGMIKADMKPKKEMSPSAAATGAHFRYS